MGADWTRMVTSFGFARSLASLARVAADSFRLWASFPAELLLGRLTPEQAAQNLAQQAIWIVVFFGLFRLVWQRGMKRYSAVGA